MIETSARRCGATMLATAVIALSACALAGCASSRTSNTQTKAATGEAKKPVEGLCDLPNPPPAELAHKPGYQQFAVSVTDSSGRSIANLKQSDFVVYTASQNFPVAHFRENKNDDPLAIALVVDTSGSMAPKLDTVKRSLGNLVTNLNRCDEVTVLAFSSRTFILLPLSTDHGTAVGRIQLFRAYGQTALYDAASNAMNILSGADYPNRVIILITDGIDNSSKANEDEVVARVKKDGVTIYAVGIGDPGAKPEEITIGSFTIQSEPRVDDKSLKALSAAAGGRTFIVPGTAADAGDGFTNAIATIADRIAHSYSVGVVLPSDIELSSVNVAVANRPNLVVHARPIAARP